MTDEVSSCSQWEDKGAHIFSTKVSFSAVIIRLSQFMVTILTV